MTDNEIIEFWGHIVELAESCDPTARIPLSVGSARETYRLIKRLKRESNSYRNKAKGQKGELARLNKRNNELNALNKTASIDAIKEFAERLNKHSVYVDDYDCFMVSTESIDNLVKEMVGDSE